MSLFIGLISGTSADAIDAALVSFDKEHCQLEAYQEYPYPAHITDQVSSIRSSSASMRLDQLSRLNVEIGHLFATAANSLITSAKIDFQQISAIGSHGQTIFHAPETPYPFSLQIGDPNTISIETGLTTVADFRNKDLAVGGEGAPLAPGFHQAIFRSKDKDRMILNLGGIANITMLPGDKEQTVTGYDTGPASALMDQWTMLHLKKSFDQNGEWGKTGKMITGLLENMLEDDYFLRHPPKSTGREYFNLEWLKEYLGDNSYRPEDIQATLQHLTVESIAQAVESQKAIYHEVIVCGGGAYNEYLLELLAKRLSGIAVKPSGYYGFSPDCIEAMAFAWLAKRRVERKPGNIPTVTGARKEVTLGAVYLPA